MSDILDDLKMLADHCDLGMLLIRAIGEIRKLRSQPVSAAEVPMPDVHDYGYELHGEGWFEVLACNEADVRTYGDAREAAGYAAGVTSGAKQMFDHIQFAAANTSDTEWDTRLCELSQDALAAVSPAAHTEWKTIQRVASESRAAGEAAGYARGRAEADQLAHTLAMARSTFKKYADMHSAKGTDEGRYKAAANMRLVEICDAALRGEVKP